MKTILRYFPAAAACLLVSASLASAHVPPRLAAKRAVSFQALGVSPRPSRDAIKSPSIATEEESHATATGGPVGGLIDRN